MGVMMLSQKQTVNVVGNISGWELQDPNVAGNFKGFGQQMFLLNIIGSQYSNCWQVTCAIWEG